LDGAKGGVAETAVPEPGERVSYDSVRVSAFTEMSDMPELIEVPRLGKSLYGTNLGGASEGTYIESICFSEEAYPVSEADIVAIYT